MLAPIRLLPVLVCAVALGLAAPAHADLTPRPVPFTESWTDTSRIAVKDDWSKVPGFFGQFAKFDHDVGTDPRTITQSFNAAGLRVNANVTSGVTFSEGVSEFHLADPTIGLLTGSNRDTVVIGMVLDTRGRRNIGVAFRTRDIDDDNTGAVAKKVAVQFRIGTEGDWTNVPDGFFTGLTQVNEFGPDRQLSVTLPAQADDQAVVQVRWISTNEIGQNDDTLGLDDIAATGDEIPPPPGEPPPPPPPPPAPVPAPPVTDTVAPQVGISTKARRASATGRFTVRVSCPASEPRGCWGVLRLRRSGTEVARRAFGLDGGEAANVPLTLTRAARRLLADRGRLLLDARTLARDAEGNARTAKASGIVVLAPR